MKPQYFPKPSQIRNHLFSPGFTLVETALALGIVSFSLIAIAGLTMTSLHTLSDANSDVRAAMIANKILSEAEILPYQSLQNRTRHFDLSGREIHASEAIFTAELEVNKGKSQGAVTSANAASLTVKVYGSGLKGQTNHYTSLQANFGL